MSIEEEIFKKAKIDYHKLENYGFKKEKDKYVMTKNILNDSFKVIITITDKEIINGQIIDLNFNEEYISYRLKDQSGSFTSKVRKEFENILINIKENCTTDTHFISNQANRIAKLIKEKYETTPEFLWKKYPEYGVFRNKHNKWFGIIMNINKNKLDKSDEEVDILNIKLPPNKIAKLLNDKGFYQAYHMNKVNWITILLDETISDNEIMTYIDESYQLTNNP